MSIEFVDRVSTYPNRYLVTPENGTPYYVVLERADEPTTVGTALNAATLNKLAALADIEKLPDMHIWKKYEGDPSLYTETEVSDVAIRSRLKMSGISSYYTKMEVADSFIVANGEITLVDSHTISSPTVINVNGIQGKYVRAGDISRQSASTVYWISEEATISETTRDSGFISYYDLIVSDAVRIDANKYLGSVMDESETKYPENGVYEDDGYWYVYHKLFGDCNGNITDDQIADAVAAYLEENPIGSGGVTMTQVNNAINSAIGDAIGGSY